MLEESDKSDSAKVIDQSKSSARVTQERWVYGLYIRGVVTLGNLFTVNLVITQS
jgi:hypothetical protein